MDIESQKAAQFWLMFGMEANIPFLIHFSEVYNTCPSGPFFMTNIATQSLSNSVLSVLKTGRPTDLLASMSYLSQHSDSGEGRYLTLGGPTFKSNTVYQNMSWPLACV